MVLPLYMYMTRLIRVHSKLLDDINEYSKQDRLWFWDKTVVVLVQ